MPDACSPTRYGHLMPGSEAEAADLLDSYLVAQRERAEQRARAADPMDQSWTNEGAIQRPEATLGDRWNGLDKRNFGL